MRDIVFVLILLSLAPFFALASIGERQDNLVILQYHHVSNSTPSITSVTPDVFEHHMQHLALNHNVVALDDALTALQQGEKLPAKAVAITFDDGYRNILDNAHPILRKYDFPYTIFINPAVIGESEQQLDWQDLKLMSQQQVTFANHTLDHAHLLTRFPNEDKAKWLARVARDIEMAEDMLSEQLGYSKRWLAYPFGEYDTDIQAMLLDKGYVGFGQQSGAVASHSDFSALPRFPASGSYASLDTLSTKLNSLAMPVVSVTPSSRVQQADAYLDEASITLAQIDFAAARFACYFAGNKVPVTQQQMTFTAKLEHRFTAGRSRMNCTAPSEQYPGRFFWYSLPWFTPTPSGEYLD